MTLYRRGRRSVTGWVLVLMAASQSAAADTWPQPAAGRSASGGPEVLFTFDDGPHERYTPLVLDTLGAHGIKAVFFWTGWRVSGESRATGERRKVALRALAEGHLVGNHTMNHAKLCLGSLARAEWEVDEAFRVLGELARMPVRLFRVPYGARCKRVENLLAARRLKHLHWDLDPMEYSAKAAGRTAAYFVSRLERLEGRAVILMHDTNYWTAKALPQVLAWIAEENARRAVAGRRLIRIISYADLAAEEVDRPLADLAANMADLALDFVPEVLEALVLPLSAPSPEWRARAFHEL